jgi:REP element-mobilizing transposase RayT
MLHPARVPAQYSARRPKHVDFGAQPYFVSTRTKGSRPLLLGDAGIAAERALFRERDKYGFLLLAYALMPDHAHFILVPTPDFTIEQTMRVVKGAMARAVQTANATSGPVWQSGFFDKNPKTLDDLNEFIRYIHNNPVKARLSETAETFSLSSANGRCIADYRRFLEMEQSRHNAASRAGFQPAL